MATDKEVIHSAQGVTLTKVTLRNGSMPADVVYVVTSKRTTEAPNFADLVEARSHFEAEIDRSRRALG